MTVVYNPWAESLENCIIGTNHLRSQEYRDLIEELDHLYSIEAENKRLRAALEGYQTAHALSAYGDSSDFIFPAITIRVKGEPDWGWVCEKHGLGYQSSCLCCMEELSGHRERANKRAQYQRDDALHAASVVAREALKEDQNANHP